MPSTRPARLAFILAASLALVLIGYNLYCRYINGALAAAVVTADVAGVRRALERGADPNYRVPGATLEEHAPLSRLARGQSILQIACSRIVDPTKEGGPERYTRDANAEEIVRLLILKGAHAQDIRYLNQACSLGDVALIRFLLDHGADLKRPGNSDTIQSALTYAATIMEPTGSFTPAAAATTPSERAQAAEHLATARQLVQILREHGAHITLTQAQNLGDAAMMHELLDGALPLDAQDGYSAMVRAANDGDLETIRLLLRRGIDPNPPRQQRMPTATGPGIVEDTPLHLAVSKGRVAIAGLLLKHGANPNVTGPLYSETALTAAVRRRDPALVRLLLAYGAHADTPGNNSPLATAAGQGDLKMMQLLLAHGAKPNGDGYSPALGAAISARHPAIVRFLLAHGATTATQPQFPYPNLSMALTNLPEVAPDLLRHGAPVNLPPRSPFPEQAPAHGNNLTFISGIPQFVPFSPLAASLWYAPQYAATLVKAGATLGWEKQYVCVAAARQKRMDLLVKLLAYGADINGADVNHDTALSICIASDPKSVQTLLQHGANPNILLRGNRYPLEQAAVLGRTEAVRLLLAHGANVNARYRQGHTAMYWAQKKRYADIVALLRQAGGTE